jgi:predicted transcriptional regulator YdeE
MGEVAVSLVSVQPRRLAAVRRKVWTGGVGAAWKPAVDQVWDFLRRHPGLRTDGHNVFLYEHLDPNGPMTVDFGVEVAGAFEPEGEIVAVETPAGEAAVAVHVGAYSGIAAAHQAIHRWCASEDHALAGRSWESYGDGSSDEAKLETTIAYLLK